MKRIIKFGSIGLVVCGAIVGGEANSQSLPEVFRSGINSSNLRVVTVTGTPRVQIPISIAGGQVTRNLSVRGNACNFAVINNASSLPNTTFGDGQFSWNPQDIMNGVEPAAPIPNCEVINGVPTPSFALPSNVNNPNQLAFKAVGNRIILKSVAANQVTDVPYSIPDSGSRFVTTNACGFANVTIQSSANTIAVNNGAAVNISSLPSYQASCVNGVLYGAGTGILPNASANPIFRDSNNNVYTSGWSSSATPSISVSGSPNTRSATSDRCGGLLIGSALNPVVGNFKVEGVTLDSASFPLGTRPRCSLVNGAYAFDAPASNVKLSNGQIYLITVGGLNVNNALRPSGFGDRSIVQLETFGERVLRANPNACGVSTFRFSALGGNTSSIINVDLFGGSNYQGSISNLPLVEPDRCVSGIPLKRLN